MLPRAQVISQDVWTIYHMHTPSLVYTESPKDSTGLRTGCHPTENVGHDGHYRLHPSPMEILVWGEFHISVAPENVRCWLCWVLLAESWPLQFIDHKALAVLACRAALSLAQHMGLLHARLCVCSGISKPSWAGTLYPTASLSCHFIHPPHSWDLFALVAAHLNSHKSALFSQTTYKFHHTVKNRPTA